MNYPNGIRDGDKTPRHTIEIGGFVTTTSEPILHQ